MEKTWPGNRGTNEQTIDYVYYDFGGVAMIEAPRGDDDATVAGNSVGPASRTETAPSVIASTQSGSILDAEDTGSGTNYWLARVGGQDFRLQVADTEASRTRGLSGRGYLAADEAMLFIFPREQNLAFWMKDVAIPIDVLFIDADRRIVSVYTMEPEPGVADQNLRVYQSGLPAKYALEIKAGAAREHGIDVGDIVELR